MNLLQLRFLDPVTVASAQRKKSQTINCSSSERKLEKLAERHRALRANQLSTKTDAVGEDPNVERRPHGEAERKARLMASNKEERKIGMIRTDEKGWEPSYRLTVMDANEQSEQTLGVFLQQRRPTNPPPPPPCGRWNRLGCFRAQKHSCCPELKQNDYSLTPEHLLLPGQVGQAGGTRSH